MPKKKRKRKKSAKKAAIGRKLAKELPRDEKGRFLPRGSKNLFRGAKRQRRRSVPAKRRRRASKRKRRASVPAMSRGRRSKAVQNTDRFPNWLTGKVVQTAADINTTVQTFTPLPRLKTIGNRATVMELLWLEIDLNDFIWTLANADFNFQMALGSADVGELFFSDPRLIAAYKINKTQLNATGAFINPTNPLRYDFQTTDGFGYLLASDSFNMTLSTGNSGTVNRVDWRLWYRFIDIPLSEFIGIVQSITQGV